MKEIEKLQLQCRRGYGHKYRCDSLGSALREKELDVITGYIRCTMPDLDPENCALVKAYVDSYLFERRNDITDLLRRVAPIFDRYNSRLMFLVLSQAGWDLDNLEKIEGYSGTPLTQHRTALCLYKLDRFLNEVSRIVNPDSPIGAMKHWYDEFTQEIPYPRNYILHATHQTPKSSAQDIAVTGMIKPSPNYHDSAPFTGVCVGLAGSFRQWVPNKEDAVTYRFTVPLSDIFPTFSTYSPLPRALGIYPKALSVNDNNDRQVPPLAQHYGCYNFEVIFPTNGKMSATLFARSLDRMRIASCRMPSQREVAVATNEGYITMASLARIAGAEDCRIQLQ